MSIRHVLLHDTIRTPSLTPARTPLLEHTPLYNMNYTLNILSCFLQTVYYCKDLLFIDIVTAQEGTKVLGKYRRKIRKVWKELCYGKAETLEDAEEEARWWWYNLV